MLNTDLEFEIEPSIISATELFEVAPSTVEKTNNVSFDANYLPFPEQNMDIAELANLIDA